MLKNKFFEVKFQTFLWVITVVSIALNAYLVASKFVSLANQDEEAELAESDSEEPTKLEIAQPQTGWINASNGVISVDLEKADTLDVVLTSAKVNSEKVAQIMASMKHAKQSTSLKSGARVQLEVNNVLHAAGIVDPKKITILSDSTKVETTYNTDTNAYESKSMKMPMEWQVQLVTGNINGSFYTSARKAGAHPNVISQLINLYSYDVDFQRDIKLGDGFKILYEYETDYRGKSVKNPKILYAFLYLKGETKELYRHDMPSGSSEYFNRRGDSIKRALLKTPINGAKISSGYGVRTHPVLGYSKMHQGLDYSAPRGTPILAAGAGKVEFVKNQSRGYGKHVQIKHNGTYSTMYAHMSRFASNLRPGMQVAQGQVIGYVGSTGLASGDHLHYEVIKSGKKVNPAKENAPRTVPLKGVELAKFKDNIRTLEQMVAELDDKKSSNVAMVSPIKKK